MEQREVWEFRFKGISALATIVSALSIIIGGCVALYTYQEQGKAAAYLKRKEMRLMEYDKKRDVYYEMVDAAATVATSLDARDAELKAARFKALYFGKAHIAVVDEDVLNAKVNFYTALQSALKSGTWPTKVLYSSALELSTACQEALLAHKFIEDAEAAKAGQPAGASGPTLSASSNPAKAAALTRESVASEPAKVRKLPSASLKTLSPVPSPAPSPAPSTAPNTAPSPAPSATTLSPAKAAAMTREKAASE